jgi:hypothetical protein
MSVSDTHDLIKHYFAFGDVEGNPNYTLPDNVSQSDRAILAEYFNGLRDTVSRSGG